MKKTHEHRKANLSIAKLNLTRPISLEDIKVHKIAQTIGVSCLMFGSCKSNLGLNPK